MTGYMHRPVLFCQDIFYQAHCGIGTAITLRGPVHGKASWWWACRLAGTTTKLPLQNLEQLYLSLGCGRRWISWDTQRPEPVCLCASDVVPVVDSRCCLTVRRWHGGDYTVQLAGSALTWLCNSARRGWIPFMTSREERSVASEFFPKRCFGDSLGTNRRVLMTAAQWRGGYFNSPIIVPSAASMSVTRHSTVLLTKGE